MYSFDSNPVICALSNYMDDSIISTSPGRERIILYLALFFWDGNGKKPKQFGKNTIYFNGYQTCKPSQVVKEVTKGDFLLIKVNKPFFFDNNFSIIYIN